MTAKLLLVNNQEQLQTNLVSFRPGSAETNPAQGCAGIFNGEKPLKMEGKGNRIFHYRTGNAPWRGVSGYKPVYGRKQNGPFNLQLKDLPTLSTKFAAYHRNTEISLSESVRSQSVGLYSMVTHLRSHLSETTLVTGIDTIPDPTFLLDCTVKISTDYSSGKVIVTTPAGMHRLNRSSLFLPSKDTKQMNKTKSYEHSGC